MPINDNEPASSGLALSTSPAHGRAALLLVECLIHGLCENSTLTTAQAIEIAERAVDVEFDHAEAADGAAAVIWRSHTLLSTIAASLGTDRADRPGSPFPVV